MKKLLKPLLFGCIALGGALQLVQAQDLAFVSNNINTDPATLLSIASNTATTPPIPLTEVNSKVVRRFSNAYTNAQNVKWYNSGKGYLAFFDIAGTKAQAYFGKGGYWYYDARFGTEKDLPADIRRTLKSNYVDYAIGKTTKVNVGPETAWIVNLQDDNNLVIARVMNNQIDEMAHYDTHLPVKKLHKKARIVIPSE
jgi:hypothetical protein